MPRELNERESPKQTEFRVWPDGTVQAACEEPYEWLSDDYIQVWSYSEEDALRFAHQRGCA